MQRYPELDSARTIAVIMMMIYHAMYDLSVLYAWDIAVFDGGWKIFARMTASLFLLLVGISFAISWERNKDACRYPIKYLQRGLGLIGLGMLISLVTSMIDPVTYVRFGILHLIGAGILLLPLFTSCKEWNVVLGIVIIAAAGVLPASTDSSLQLIVGIPYSGFVSVDYFPLIPWFGVVLIGYGMGYLLYVRSTSWRRILPNDPWPSMIVLPGRYALWIYILHQPIFLLVLTMAMGKPQW